MITVLHSHPTWLPQTMTWLYNQVRYLPADQIEGHVVCERTANLDQFAVPNLHSLDRLARPRAWADRGARKLRLRRHLALLVRVARRSGASVLHSHFGHTGWADLGAAEQAGLRHVVTFYGLDVNHLPVTDSRWRERYAELFERVALVLCEGPHMARCIAGLGCPPDKVRVQRLGVDLNAIAFRPRTLGRGDPLRVLIAATFREKKGIVYAFEALGRVSAEHRLELTVIGDATSEPRSQEEKQRILEAAQRAGLAPRVRWMGFRPHHELLEQAFAHHVFLSPSVTARDGDTEGGAPVTLIEMAASGMMIVSTDHCDIPQVIEHGVSGYLAPERDAEALARGLRELVARPEAWLAMAEAGRRRADSLFCARAQARELASRYRGLVEERVRAGSPS